MTIRFDHDEIEALLVEIETYTGRKREEVLLDALRNERERLDIHKARQREEALASARLLREVWHARPLIDPRPIDEILAYDDDGLPI